MDDLILRSDAIKAACAGASYSDIKKITKNIKNVPAVYVKPECCSLIEKHTELATDLIPLVVDNNVIKDCWVCGNCGHRIVWPTHKKKKLKYCWNCGIKFKEALHD